jgi:hypothetical protein
MWPYNDSELAFINSGAGLNPKEKKMSIETITEFYRNTANVVLAYVPNKEIKEVFNKIVDVQVDLVKITNNTVTNTLKTLSAAK